MKETENDAIDEEAESDQRQDHPKVKRWRFFNVASNHPPAVQQRGILQSENLLINLLKYLSYF